VGPLPSALMEALVRVRTLEGRRPDTASGLDGRGRGVAEIALLLSFAVVAIALAVALSADAPRPSETGMARSACTEAEARASTFDSLRCGRYVVGD
jgi:hypothetical protein